MPEPRYAIYFTPEHGSPLERFGASVLGYDCYSGEPVSHAAFGHVAEAVLQTVSAEPRRYGFHATLKAPLRLAPGLTEAAFLKACRALAAALPIVAIGPLQVASISSFIALTPAAASTELMLLAAECVASLDPFRAPLTEGELARRRAAGLDGRQTALLGRWGYPYVFNRFRFHMTLTGALQASQQPEWLARLSVAFTPLATQAPVVDALTVLRQNTAADAFVVIERIKLSADAAPGQEQAGREQAGR